MARATVTEGTLDPRVLELAQAANFAALTVHLASGAAMTNVMWVDADTDHMLVNTEIGNAKFGILERDPRATVVVWQRENPYRYVEVRGRVVEIVRGPAARSHLDALSRKYNGHDYADEIRSERVILKIAPEEQRIH